MGTFTVTEVAAVGHFYAIISPPGGSLLRRSFPTSRSLPIPGPGEYRSDSTEGITRGEDLPKPKIRCPSRNYRRRPGPGCGHRADRDRQVRRTLHDLGNPLTGRPCNLILIYSQHDCTGCRKYFNAAMTDLAEPGSHSTRRVIDGAVRWVIEDGLPDRAASWSLWRDHRVFVPYATIPN